MLNMTHRHSLIAFLALIGLSFFPSACAMEEGDGEHVKAKPTTLSLVGEASIRRAPDIAYINIGVNTEAETARAALTQNSAKMQRVFESLEAAGIEKKNIQTRNFSLSPKYSYERNRSRRLEGFAASNLVEVKITDLDNMGVMLDALISSGSNTLNNIRFALEDETEAMDAARRQAVKNAMARAELYADATGYKVERILSIQETGAQAPMPSYRTLNLMESANAASHSAAPPISGGELGLTARVQIIFALVPK